MQYLVDLLPSSARKKVYAVYGLLGIIGLAITAAFVGQDSVPLWAKLYGVVYAGLGGGVGAMATANTNPPAPVQEVPPPEGNVTISSGDQVQVVVEGEPPAEGD